MRRSGVLLGGGVVFLTGSRLRQRLADRTAAGRSPRYLVRRILGSRNAVVAAVGIVVVLRHE